MTDIYNEGTTPLRLTTEDLPEGTTPLDLTELEYMRALNAKLDAIEGPPHPIILAWVEGEIENARIKLISESWKGGSGE